MSPTELTYWSRRAEREAVAAAAAADGQVAALHAELSRLYAAQVIRELAAPPSRRAATRP